MVPVMTCRHVWWNMSPMPDSAVFASAQAVQDMLQEAASLLRVHFGIPDT
jgi:hypothetical protein